MMKKFLSITALFLLLLLIMPAAAQDIIPNDTTKTIIMHFHIGESTVTFLDARVIYGHPPNNPDIPVSFTAKMLAADDRQIKQFGVPDPRITFLDEGYSFTDDINFSVKVPASADLTAVGIYDTKTGALLARADTVQVMKDFCAAHPRDPDCSGRGQNAPLSPVLIGGAVLLLLLTAGARRYILEQGEPPVEK